MCTYVMFLIIVQQTFLLMFIVCISIEIQYKFLLKPNNRVHIMIDLYSECVKH